MKWVRVTNAAVDVRVLCTWENKVAEGCEELGLVAGADMTIFYRNNKDGYLFEGESYYTKPYHPQEILDLMLGKSQVLGSFIKEFDLELSV